MRSILLAIATCVACGAAQPTIKTPQDFDNTVVDLVHEVIEAFKGDGINCDLLQKDLHSIGHSPKMNAAKEYKSAHPEAKQAAAEKVASFKDEFQKAATAGLHQCGAELEETFATLGQ